MIRIALECFIGLAFILGMFGVCQQKGWRGIVPLVSTRTEVEKVLGDSSDSPIVTYVRETELVALKYSTGKCDDGWNVPANTVIGIAVFPKPRPRFEDLKLDFSKFKKKPGDSDVDDHFYYEDKEAGFVISVKDGYVSHYSYVPTTVDKSLKCEKVLIKE